MSARAKRLPKTRTSKRFCQEKYNCQSDPAEASYECAQCKSYQCSDCETKLHQESKLQLHDRTIIESPPDELLCQYLSCDEKNYADVRCDDCHGNYCFKCNEEIHKSLKRKGHKIIKMKEYLESKKKAAVPSVDDNEDDYKSIEENLLQNLARNPTDLVMPSSPLQNMNSDSFTYASLPQGNDDDLEFPNHASGSPCSKSSEKPIIQQPNASARAATPPKNSSANTITAQPVPSPRALNFECSTQKQEATSSKVKMSLSSQSIPDVAANVSGISLDDEAYADCKSFLLADDQENLKVSTAKEFREKLGCDSDDGPVMVKVVSIFGNTGDGKSHTLNHAFFGGKEVFKTSTTQDSCTVGAWAAFDHVHKAVIIDTEGLLGISTNQNQRTRLLLKMLAITDVVIYRTRAERLHSDLYRFLGDASQSFDKHFTPELTAKAQKYNLPLCDLGPSVVVFHETQHTEVLGDDGHTSAEALLRKRFCEEGYPSLKAFKAMCYVGTKTTKAPTDFRGLRRVVKEQLNNKEVRSPRKLEVIFNALKVLNDKFNGDIERVLPSTFPDQYFTCSSECLSCGVRCSNSMNHKADNIPHNSKSNCIYQEQFDNKLYICKTCYKHGLHSEVVPKASASTDNQWLSVVTYAVNGYVLECSRCGVIYRSRQHWYGNKHPEEGIVRTEVGHVWPGGRTVLQGTHNAARRLLDGVNYLSDAVSSVSAKPTKMLGKYIADKVVNPSYWKPNSDIMECHQCKRNFDESETIHHCRACGEGVCDDCSTNKKPVPERGWGEKPVRVCDSCFSSGKSLTESNSSDSSDPQITTRLVTEGITNTLGAVASAFDYPMGVIKDSVRPVYWKPDDQITKCNVCKVKFSMKVALHHCRACGEGVCNDCSLARRPVPSRGWDHDVRVCKVCNRKQGDL